MCALNAVIFLAWFHLTLPLCCQIFLLFYTGKVSWTQMSLLQRSAQIYPLLEHQALCQLFTSGEFTFVEESRGRSWHNIYTYPLLRCLNFLDFKFPTFDSVTHSKQRPLVQVCRDKQGIDSPLLSPPSQHYAANVEKLPGFRAGMQTQLKILRSLPKP